MTRSTMPTLPRCWKTLTRKRPRPATPYAMSSSVFSLNFCFCRFVIMLNAMFSMSSLEMREYWVSGAQFAIHADVGIVPNLQMQVGGLVFAGGPKQCVNVQIIGAITHLETSLRRFRDLRSS